MITDRQVGKEVHQVLSFYHPLNDTIFFVLSKRQRKNISFGVFLFRKGKTASFDPVAEQHRPILFQYHRIDFRRRISNGI